MTWTNYIINDITTKLASNKPLPEPPTLQFLSKFYNVSITPVRAAVNELINRKILIKKENGRLEFNKRSAIPAKNLSSKTSAPPKDYFEAIINDMVMQSLKGASVFLREEDIADSYNISRTQVRQIFSKLEGYGIINHLPRKGWELRAFTKKDLHAFLEIREVLELKALKLAYDKLEKTKLRKFLDNNQLPAKGKKLKIDNSLHEYIIETADNRYISDFFAQHGKYYSILFAWEDLDQVSARQAVIQHRKFLNALLKDNYSAAQKSLSDHIHNNHKLLESINPKNIQKISKLKFKDQ